MEARRLGTGLTLEDVQELTATMYRGWNLPSGEEEDIHEIALSANYTCYECGQEGHKASNCPKRRAGDRSKGPNRGQSGSKILGKCRPSFFFCNLFLCKRIWHQNATF